MVDNVRDRVKLPEKVVISKKKKVITFFAVNINRLMWLLCHKICIAFFTVPTDKKVWETLH